MKKVDANTLAPLGVVSGILIVVATIAADYASVKSQISAHAGTLSDQPGIHEKMNTRLDNYEGVVNQIREDLSYIRGAVERLDRMLDRRGRISGQQ